MTTSATRYRVRKVKNLLYALFTSLALTTGASQVLAQPGTALNFDGVDDNVTVATDPILNGANSYTKEAWVRLTDYSKAFPNIISSAASAGDARHFLYINGDRLTAGHNNDPFGGATNPSVFPENQWVHVAVTYNHATTTMRLYQDAALVATTSVPQITGTSAPLYIGMFVPSGAPDNFLFGDIDEVRIWNTVRTADEIKQFRKAELTGTETGLVAYYRFNQGIAAGDNTAITALTATTGTNGTLNNFTRNTATSNFVGGLGNAGVATGSKYTIWNGTSWSAGVPLNIDASIISATTPSQPGTFVTGQLYVTSALTLTIASGESVEVSGDLDYIGSTVEVLPGGSFIQTATSVGPAVIASNAASRFRVRRNDAQNNVGYNYISSPVGNITMGTIGNNDFAGSRFSHNPNLAPGSRWIPVPGGTVMASGIGYTYVQGAGNQNLLFESANGITGRPRNGNINITLTGTPTYRFNLVGNPYPSPLSMRTFFDNNNAAINSLSFWIDNNNGTGSGSYQTRNNVNILASDRIAVAQGFMVEALTTPPQLQFNNGQRIAATTALLRSEEAEQVEMERFKMTVSRNGERDELWVAFSKDFTSGRDNGYDAAKLDGTAGVSLAARWNDERLAIAALPKPEAGQAFELPLTLMVRNAGSYTVATEDVPNATGEKLFLEDRTTGEFYYLQAGKSHALDLQAGNYRDRFFLRRASEVSTVRVSGESNAYAFDRSLFVQAEGNVQVALFSTMGTEVQRFANVNGAGLRRLETNVPASGVYIVRVYTQDGVSERRVWLEK
jgi:hypothetical protein